MEKIKKLILPFIFLNLLVLDGVGLYVGFFKSKPSPTIPATNETSTPQITYQDQCGTECQKYITDQLAVYKLPTPQPTTKPKTLVVPTVAKTTRVTYVPIPSNGNTTANDWVDLPGTDFYFNTSDYSGLKQVQFEATMRLQNANGTAYVRLFDATNGIAVQGSQVETSSQTSTVVVASPLNFWAGRNLIRVQGKSLTADTAIFDGGRLKVITEN